MDKQPSPVTFPHHEPRKGRTGGAGMMRARQVRQRLILGAALLLALAGGPPRASAQEFDAYPADILQGSCERLGPAVFSLPDLRSEFQTDASPVPAVEQMGPAAAVPVMMSQTALDVPVTRLWEEEHALVITGPDGRIIACGVIGGPMILQMAGMVMPGDQLVVGVGEREDSGYAGIAFLTAKGLSTTINVYLIVQPSQEGSRSPAATPQNS